MKYKRKNRNLIKNKEEKKKFVQLNEESKVKMNNHIKNKRDFENNFYDLEYFRNNPTQKNFYERYKDISLMKSPNIPKLEDNEKRKEIFIEISESLNSIKNEYKKKSKNE